MAYEEVGQRRVDRVLRERTTVMHVAFEDIGGDLSGDDVHHPHSKGLHLDTQCVSVVNKCSLGCIVSCSKDVRTDASNGPDVDHGTARTDEHPVKMMHHAHWSEDVYCKHLFDLRDVRIGRCHCICDSSIVDQDVELGARDGFDLCFEWQHLFLSCHVEVQNMDLGMVEVFSFFMWQECCDDVQTVCDETFRKSMAYTTLAAPGDGQK
jgi:hypothetical protein